MDNNLYDYSQVYKELLQQQYKMNRETNKILQSLSISQKEMTLATTGINDTLSAINETLEANTAAVKAVDRFWGKIVWALVITVIVLAGAEKALQFLAP